MDWAQLALGLVGGGGLGTLAFRLFQILRDHKAGTLQREKTVIGNWAEIAAHAQADADARIARNQAELSWYRHHYARLWQAYNRLPPADKESFPTFVPPPPTAD